MQGLSFGQIFPKMQKGFPECEIRFFAKCKKDFQNKSFGFRFYAKAFRKNILIYNFAQT